MSRQGPEMLEGGGDGEAWLARHCYYDGLEMYARERILVYRGRWYAGVTCTSKAIRG